MKKKITATTENRVGVAVRVFERRDSNGYLLSDGWECGGCDEGGSSYRAREEAQKHAKTCSFSKP
ncbi:hypothetical protein [Streptomyces sparsogenes]|uniref:Uncharacterized protein n=1 Tax=Streptomyces sparsogenes DSM 40356 TaxID=1331668 RepID=A0A1R1S7V5_9ACTN|nr:hypothetical protein [Streptomyces sparsogenes]OMI34405.1 hypothetical protein SPAR_36516 [Streptomyces sparsogenes DSM 40356]